MFGFIGDAWDSLTGQADPNAAPNLQAEPRRDARMAERQLGTWALEGKGPSAAQGLIEQNRSQNAATQLGMAKSMGGDPALANRNAANAIASGNSAATFQGSVMRAQEQQQAMQNYLDSLHATRGQDLGYQGMLLDLEKSNAQNSMDAWLGIVQGFGGAAGGMAAGGGAGGGGGGAAAAPMA